MFAVTRGRLLKPFVINARRCFANFGTNSKNREIPNHYQDYRTLIAILIFVPVISSQIGNSFRSECSGIDDQNSENSKGILDSGNAEPSLIPEPQNNILLSKSSHVNNKISTNDNNEQNYPKVVLNTCLQVHVHGPLQVFIFSDDYVCPKLMDLQRRRINVLGVTLKNTIRKLPIEHNSSPSDDVTEKIEPVVIVTRVDPDSNADKAGLRSGDIVLFVNDHSIESINDRVWEKIEQMKDTLDIRMIICRLEEHSLKEYFLVIKHES